MKKGISGWSLDSLAHKPDQWSYSVKFWKHLKVKLKVCASLINVMTVCGFRRGSDHERCSRSEEDFYYTEINQWEQQTSPPLPVLCSPAPPSPASSSPSSPPSPPPPSPPSPASPTCSTLSRSAPSSSGSSWQVQSEHSYQVGGAERQRLAKFVFMIDGHVIRHRVTVTLFI